MRRAAILFAAVTGLFLQSCSPAPTVAIKPPTDYTKAHQSIWSAVPASVKFGLTAGSAAHLLDRANALEKLLAGGPKGRAFFTKHMDELKSKLGFDPLDAGAWKQKNLDLDGPVGLFLFENGDGLLAAKPLDAAKAKVDWAAALTTTTICTQAGALLYCGDARTPVAQDAKASVWPLIAKDLTPAQAAAELQFFLPLEAQAQKDAPGMPAAIGDFVKASRSAFVGLTLSDDEIHLQAAYVNPKSSEIAPYLPVNNNEKSILGAAAGSRGVARVNLSLPALWAYAKRQLGEGALDKASGMMLVATGLDLQKDIAENLTGEILAVTYDNGGFVEMLGARDEERTKKLVERLDSLSWGGLQTVREVIESKGFKIDHRVDTVKNRQRFVFQVHLPRDADAKDPQAKDPIDNLFELHLAAGPGALLVAFDKESCDRAIEGLGKPASAFISQLRPEAQEPFSSGAPLAFWGQSFNLMQTFDYAQKVSDAQRDLMRKTYGAIDPDLPDLIWELSSLGSLIYDGIGSFSIATDRMTLDYRITLL